ELPVLMIVMNNGWGISTSRCSQHGDRPIIDRGLGFGIDGEVVDGNDPIASWHAIVRAMDYCRKRRRPYMLERTVARLHGHSSSSGALRVTDEPDCIALFEQKLLEAGVVEPADLQRIHSEAYAEAEAALQQTLTERKPAPSDIEKFTYAPSPVDAVYPGDYTGLPQ